MDFLKQMKAARRRSVETILESVGKSEKTVDEEFEMLSNKFEVMIKDMNECGAAVTSTISQQKNCFADCKELAAILSRIYRSNGEDTEWPHSHNKMRHIAASAAYKGCWEIIHDVYRSSAAMVLAENGLDPLKKTVTELHPAITTERKTRTALLTDYDSYRRRLKALEAKRDSTEAQGKGGSEKAAEILAEIAKYEAKVQNSEEQYSAQNAKVKQDILAAKDLHDELVDSLLITTIVCQADLFARAAHDLEEILSTLPPDQVAKAREKIGSYTATGGVTVNVKEPSLLQKGLAIASGKAVPSDFKKDSSQPVNPFEEEEEQPAPATNKTPGFATAPAIKSPGAVAPPAAPVTAPSAPPPPPPAAPPAAGGKKFVVALYDHEAEADDELSFKTGQRVEVVDDSDEGWWRGRVDGREGLFPVNYVEKI